MAWEGDWDVRILLKEKQGCWGVKRERLAGRFEVLWE